MPLLVVFIHRYLTMVLLPTEVGVYWPPNFIMLKYIHLVHKFTAPPSFVAIAYTIQWTLLCQ